MDRDELLPSDPSALFEIYEPVPDPNVVRVHERLVLCVEGLRSFAKMAATAREVQWCAIANRGADVVAGVQREIEALLR